jgi:lysophospholipid acyltransferase (LPLAT)-like uncharacterized protein
MLDQEKSAPDYSDIETRRNKMSRRRMSAGRRLAYAIGKPLLQFALFVLTRSYRFQTNIGSDVANRMIADEGRAYVPVLWHAQQIAVTHTVRSWVARGFRASYIISASVDGEVVADIARSWGIEVIRGSAQNSGALVLRDAMQMMKRGVSVATSTDGPLGPPFEIKTGTVLMARVAGAPIVPIVCAASRAWTLNTWDHFVIPKPFARVILAIGEPIQIPRDAPMRDIESARKQVQAAMESLAIEAKQQLS